jgi:hypothetical protein
VIRHLLDALYLRFFFSRLLLFYFSTVYCSTFALASDKSHIRSVIFFFSKYKQLLALKAKLHLQHHKPDLSFFFFFRKNFDMVNFNISIFHFFNSIYEKQKQNKTIITAKLSLNITAAINLNWFKNKLFKYLNSNLYYMKNSFFHSSYFQEK